MVMLRITHIHVGIVAIGLGLMSLVAIAQTPPPATPDRLGVIFAGNEGKTCLDLISKPKKPVQAACYVTGVANRLGFIEKPTAKCEDASFEQDVATCFGGFLMKDAYLGYSGPVCAGLLVDVHADSSNPSPNAFVRRINTKEVYPCEGRTAPPISVDDFVPGVTPVAKWESPFKRLKATDCSASPTLAMKRGACVVRSAFGANGEKLGKPQAVCSDDRFENDARACMAGIGVKDEHRANPPAELCLRIDYYGGKMNKGGRASASSIMKSCPKDFFPAAAQ